MSAPLKGQWTNVSDLLTKMADAMPDDAYRFRPTPEMQDLGQRMAQVLTFNMRGWLGRKGRPESRHRVRLKGIVPPSSNRNER